jgi:hypothetical protein
VKAAAAPGCLDVALDHWIDSDGQPDLTGLLDEAFTALARIHQLLPPKRWPHRVAPAA